LLIARPTSKAQTARTKMMAAVAALCLAYISSRFLLPAARAQSRVTIPFDASTAHSPLYNPAPSLSTPQPIAPTRPHCGEAATGNGEPALRGLCDKCWCLTTRELVEPWPWRRGEGHGERRAYHEPPPLSLNVVAARRCPTNTLVAHAPSARS
jgi:hypothetical protein